MFGFFFNTLWAGPSGCEWCGLAGGVGPGLTRRWDHLGSPGASEESTEQRQWQLLRWLCDKHWHLWFLASYRSIQSTVYLTFLHPGLCIWCYLLGPNSAFSYEMAQLLLSGGGFQKMSFGGPRICFERKRVRRRRLEIAFLSRLYFWAVCFKN